MQTPAVYPLDKTRRVAGRENTLFSGMAEGETGYPIVDAAMRQQCDGLDA